MTSRLPLFPLNHVLFPWELLPLHIFEPRYRRLLADCLEGDQRFGITADESPGPETIGCVARIRGTQVMADGRSNIVVLGERRFGIQALLEAETPYLVAAVEEFGDEPGTDPLPTESEALRHLATALRETLGILADQPGEPTAWDEDPETFTFQVAGLVQLEAAARTSLLACRSTRERARALASLLPTQITQLRQRAEIHVRARSNGAGHAGHDIVLG
jgi:Lon protease-like protein